MRRFLTILAGGYFAPALAFAALAAIVGAAPAWAAGTTVDLTPLAGVGMEFAGALMSVVATWALTRLMKWLKVDADSKANAMLHAAIGRAIDGATGRFRSQLDATGWTVDARNMVVADVLTYLAGHVPGTLRQLGATPEALAAVVHQRLDGTVDRERSVAAILSVGDAPPALSPAAVVTA